MAASGVRNETESTGQLILTNKSISFRGTTILLPNIAKFEQYGITRTNTVSILHMIIATIVICIFIQYMFWGLLFVIPGALVIYWGIKERQRPDLYGITLELNSGYKYNFISKDANGIRSLYTKIKERYIMMQR